jgi:Lhr-like helicase
MKKLALNLREQEFKSSSLYNRLFSSFLLVDRKLWSSKRITLSYFIYRSRTGTGKTLSFLLPLEELIRVNKENDTNKGIQAIILEPTRELAS